MTKNTFIINIDVNERSYTSNLCLQIKKKKTVFESLSHDFSTFKNVVVSLTNLYQGQLKISQENAKLPRKPRNRKRIFSLKTLTDVMPFSPIAYHLKRVLQMGNLTEEC